jgi:hypothetical protein
MKNILWYRVFKGWGNLCKKMVDFDKVQKSLEPT